MMGAFVPLGHGMTPDDLQFSEYLWERNSLNPHGQKDTTPSWPSPHPAQDNYHVELDSSIATSSLSKLPAAQPTENVTSDIKAKKSWAKTGPGSQHCSACGTLGHKSMFIIPLVQLASKKNPPIESNPQCPKALSQATSNHSTQLSLSKWNALQLTV